MSREAADFVKGNRRKREAQINHMNLDKRREAFDRYAQ